MASSLLALTLRRATIATVSTTNYAKLLHPRIPLTTTSTAISRSLFSRSSSSTGSTSESSESSDSELPKPDEEYTLHPLQISGPKAAIALKTEKDPKFKTMRVIMPGVGKDRYKVRLDEEINTIFFEGQGKAEMEDEDSGRTYEGKIGFRPQAYKIDKVLKTEIKHGSIWKATHSRSLVCFEL